jgi:putative flippase GtrA
MVNKRIARIIKVTFSREVIVYLIAGVLATLVNVVVFTLLCAVFGNDQWWISNAPAILAAILFAFFANRIFVFRSRGPILQEFWKFFTSRILISLAFEYGAMALLYDLIGLRGSLYIFYWDILIAKLLTQILVMAGNYIVSKWFIFTAKKPAKG